MKNRMLVIAITIGCLGLLLAHASEVRAEAKKVKVYLLAGQSNMEGHGQLRSLDWLGKHPEYGHLLKKLKNDDGSWAVRDDVTISWNISLVWK